ncbi:MAG TPA: hypothetical protein EYP29_05555 [Thermoplasmata archaeon]|nr:hypothetical protein [Thermoplasmata archaeon]
MNPKIKLREMLDLLSRLRNEGGSCPIIVEGKKDVRSLRSLGFEGEILQLNRGKSLLHFCEELKLKYEKVIILCDWDRTGGRLTHSLTTYLENLGVDYDTHLRKELIFISKKRMKDVEGMLSYITDLLNELNLSYEIHEIITLYEKGKIPF